MLNKVLSMKTAKTKAVAITLGTALVTSLGAVTGFAANSMNTLQIKEENGVRSYSTDDGKTWTHTAPKGATIKDEDGKITITNGAPPEDGKGNQMLIKVEGGIKYYSTDGGKSWSQNAPKGVTVNNDGSVVKKN